MQHRAKLADDGISGAHTWMDCSHCTVSPAVRRQWGCGWLPASERRRAQVPVPSEYPHERPEVCPGYLVQQPQVIEAARACSWRKEGALREFYDGEPLTPLAKWAIDVMAGAIREVEQEQIRRSAKER